MTSAPSGCGEVTLDPNERTPCLPQAPPPPRPETTCGPSRRWDTRNMRMALGEGPAGRRSCPQRAGRGLGGGGTGRGRGTLGCIWETQAAGAKALWLGACWGGAAGVHLAQRRSSGVQAGSCWGGAAGGHVARWGSSGTGGHVARWGSSGAGRHLA